MAYERCVAEITQSVNWPHLAGNYMSYKGPGVSQVSRLIHPCPSDDHLGTHLTLDLDGNVRFGPDVEHIGDPSISSANADFWRDDLTPSAQRIASIGNAVKEYLPGIDPTLLAPDYSRIRPDISRPNSGFSDFFIRHSGDRKGLVEMMGFNSPGLTSGLAVGEYVAAMIKRDVWKAGVDVEALAQGYE